MLLGVDRIKFKDSLLLKYKSQSQNNLVVNKSVTMEKSKSPIRDKESNGDTSFNRQVTPFFNQNQNAERQSQAGKGAKAS